MISIGRTARGAGWLTALLVCASVALAAGAPPAHYTLDPAHSQLRFSFVQAGATNTGHFGKYTTDVLFSDANLEASRIDVSVDIASIDTGDKERDDTLKSADLFDLKKFPQARFVTSRIVASGGAGRFEAQGKLTIRNVTRDIRIPITFQTKPEQGKSVGYMTGRVTVKRLDYGVGQGDWKSTEWVGDDVTVTFSLRLLPAAT